MNHENHHPKKAVIIGAGPAGLTAAAELLNHPGILPVIFEASGDIGGIAKTADYKGNKIDIGGHRFFSKSGAIMKWWTDLLPPEKHTVAGVAVAGPDPAVEDRVMLTRHRRSSIFFLRKFYDYPLSLSWQTLSNLGWLRLGQIFVGYLRARMNPIRNPKNLEEFFINHFGETLYKLFFKSYTQKVWGVPCRALAASWGAQRVKGLNIVKALTHAARKILFFKDDSLDQKHTETSLIERFLYPKYGPGQLWRAAADRVRSKGGAVHLHCEVTGLIARENRIVQAQVRHTVTGRIETIDGDYFFSSMPIKDLIKGLKGVDVPSAVREVAEDLRYRDFITVGLLLKKLDIRKKPRQKGLIPDQWVYIQEKDVKLGRVQIFNNWSPYLVKTPGTVWIGLEYFCNEGDTLWNHSDEALRELAVRELVKLGFIHAEDVLDGTVLRMKKAYPAYCGGYGNFGVLRSFLDRFENLFLIGRNGMHRYNNMDHSMLTAMAAVSNVRAGVPGKDNIWAINTEEIYQERRDHR